MTRLGENDPLGGPFSFITNTAVEESKSSKQSNPNKLLKQSKHLKQDKQSKQSNSTSKGLPKGWTRATFIVKEDKLDKVKDYAYWERLQVKEVLDLALDEFFEGKRVRGRKNDKETSLIS